MFTISKILRRTVVASALVVCATLPTAPASAADDVIQLDLQQALNAPDTLAHNDGSVKFYFGQTAHPSVISHLGMVVTNQKGGFWKSTETACRTTFLDALRDLQAKAKSAGGNAVINVESYFRKRTVEIGVSVPCYPGGFRVGIALRGEIVKVAI
jgi:uncharacterized protein YbjQ (UPF0145 family)